MTSVSILGGGIAGLSAAHYLSKLKSSNISKIIVYESTNRLGGWINSSKQPSGTFYEVGPRSLRSAGIPGANTIALAHSLGLESDILPITYDHPSTKFRMISVGGELHKLPSSFAALFKKSSPFTKPIIASLLKDLWSPKILNTDESLYSFINRRFDSEVASYLIDPIARGVFAGNARELSVKSLAKGIHEYEQLYGGIIKGALFSFFKREEKDEVLLNSLVKKARKEKWAAWSIDGGLEKFSKVLENDVISRGVEIRKNVCVNSLEKNMKGGINICSSEGLTSTDHVISCLPANILSKVTSTLDKDLSTLLNKIPYVTVSVVNLEYDDPNILENEAFGYLVPSTEPSKVLGVIFDTCTFPQHNKTIFTVMMGGYWFESLFGKDPSEDEILDIAVNEVTKSLGLKVCPNNSKVSILKECIPQYKVGHVQNVEYIRRLVSSNGLPLTVAGNAYDGVGINDTILSARRMIASLNF